MRRDVETPRLTVFNLTVNRVRHYGRWLPAWLPASDGFLDGEAGTAGVAGVAAPPALGVAGTARVAGVTGRLAVPDAFPRTLFARCCATFDLAVSDASCAGTWGFWRCAATLDLAVSDALEFGTPCAVSTLGTASTAARMRILRSILYLRLSPQLSAAEPTQLKTRLGRGA